MRLDSPMIEAFHGDKEGIVDEVLEEEEVCKIKDKLDLDNEASSEDVKEFTVIEHEDVALDEETFTASMGENDCSHVEETFAHYTSLALVFL